MRMVVDDFFSVLQRLACAGDGSWAELYADDPIEVFVTENYLKIILVSSGLLVKILI